MKIKREDKEMNLKREDKEMRIVIIKIEYLSKFIKIDRVYITK